LEQHNVKYGAQRSVAQVGDEDRSILQFDAKMVAKKAIHPPEPRIRRSIGSGAATV
jgi:hypothetical protein